MDPRSIILSRLYLIRYKVSDWYRVELLRIPIGSESEPDATGTMDSALIKID
jgi:hypothetical protein